MKMSEANEFYSLSFSSELFHHLAQKSPHGQLGDGSQVLACLVHERLALKATSCMCRL